MFQLTDLRKTRVWQEAREEGAEQGETLAQARIVHHCLAQGMSVKQIAQVTGIRAARVRQLAKFAMDNGDAAR